MGIGASPDGREAVERFLQRIPSDSGLAYVLVQHRSPEHEGLLAESLGHATIAIPDVLARRQPDGVRIWAAGCSSGEEAYSLAILVREQPWRPRDLPCRTTSGAPRRPASTRT